MVDQTMNDQHTIKPYQNNKLLINGAPFLAGSFGPDQSAAIEAVKSAVAMWLAHASYKQIITAHGTTKTTWGRVFAALGIERKRGGQQASHRAGLGAVR
jgi:hypothetical protein